MSERVDPGWRPVILGTRIPWRRATPGALDRFDGMTPAGKVQIFGNGGPLGWQFRWWPRGWRGQCFKLDGFVSAKKAAEAGARIMEAAHGKT